MASCNDLAKYILIMTLALAAFGQASAQQSAGGASTGGQSLDQAAADPTASLMNVQIGNWYTDSYWNLPDEDGNTVSLRSAYPFSWGKTKHIMRATVPIITHSPSGSSGFSDITLFDLMVFDRSWGRWGVGPVALIPTGGSNRGTEKWAVGPAFGFVKAKPKLIIGIFNQNLFTVAGDSSRPDVNVSIIQPIINKQLGKGWSLGSSEMSITWDWDQDDWASLPLGTSFNKMTRPGGIPVQWSLQYEYNFADDQVIGKNTFRMTAKLLCPTN